MATSLLRLQQGRWEVEILFEDFSQAIDLRPDYSEDDYNRDGNAGVIVKKDYRLLRIKPGAWC